MLSKKWSLFSIITYILFGVIFDDIFLTFHPYANYIFDSIFVLFFLIKATSHIRISGALNKAAFIQYSLIFLLGFGVYKFAEFKNIPIPFDLSAKETLLFLLLIGPILEELIFRFCLLNLAKVYSDKFIPIILSSLLFSFSHFIAYFEVPDRLQGFVIYQTLYTLIIGLWFSISYNKKRSITLAILLHMFFNLGFFLASQFQIIKL